MRKAPLVHFLRRRRGLYRALDGLRWAAGRQPPVRVGGGEGDSAPAVSLRCNRFSHVEQMLRRGRFEPARLALFRRWVPRFGRLLDLGANVGLYALLAARGGVPALAFEPEPANLRRLRANVRDNGLAELIRVEPVALGASAGTLALHRALSDNRGMATAHAHGPIGYDTVRVPRATLDSFGLLDGDKGEVPTLIKCDIEGGEAAMLAGAVRFLENAAEVLWMVEVHRCYGVEPKAIATRFRRVGYPAVCWYDERSGTCTDELTSSGDPLLLAGRGRGAALIEAELMAAVSSVRLPGTRFQSWPERLGSSRVWHCVRTRLPARKAPPSNRRGQTPRAFLARDVAVSVELGSRLRPRSGPTRSDS